MLSQNRLTVFFSRRGGGGAPARGKARLLAKKSTSKTCTPFQGSSKGALFSDTARVRRGRRSIARLGAHGGARGPDQGEKRTGGARMFLQKTEQAARAFLLFREQAGSSRRRGIIIIHPSSLSLAPALLAHHCLFFSSSRIPKTSGSASTRGVSASGKTPSIVAAVFSFCFEEERGAGWFFFFSIVMRCNGGSDRERLCEADAEFFFSFLFFSSFLLVFFTRAPRQTRPLRRSRPRRGTGTHHLPPRLLLLLPLL